VGNCKTLCIKTVVAVLFILSFSTLIHAENRLFTVMHWNVENLFDTVDDPEKDDGEFTPDGKAQWTEEKLAIKLKNLARVVRTVNNGDGPAVLTLVEVENLPLLERWCQDDLADLGYTPILIQGPDVRGINVALLTKFPLMDKPISLRVSDQRYGRPTRDTLIVPLNLNNVPLFVMVNHWPSRLGGDHAAEYRQAIASKVRQAVQKILKKDAEADVIIAGDFNDETEDASFLEGLKTTWDWNTLFDPSQLSLFPIDYELVNLPLMMKSLRRKTRV